MPCHVDEFKPDASKKQIDELILVVDGRITMKEVGDSFHGTFPTVRELVQKQRQKGKTFSYKVKGSTLVIVSPCPKGC